MRMRSLSRFLLIPALLALVPALPAQEEGSETAAGMTVTRAAVALGVEARQPVGEGTSFPADVEELAFFTRVEGAQEETVIHHVWLYGEEEKARIELPVRSSSWRTWSLKTILPEWTGEWTVRAEDADGNLLASVGFTIE